MNETFVVTPSDGKPKKPETSGADSQSCIFAFENGHDGVQQLRKCVYQRRLLVAFLCICTIASVSAYVCVLGPIFFEKSAFKFHRFDASAIDVQHFRLRLDPHLDKGTFRGRASIVFTSRVRTKELILVAHSLSISNVSLTRRTLIDLHPDTASEVLLQRKRTQHVAVESGTLFANFSATSVAPSQAHDHLTRIRSSHVFGEGQFAVRLKDPLDALAEYMLDMHFSGSLLASGFRLQHHEGGEHLLRLQTACRTFPFFDNGKRTTFELSVARPRHMVALSNTRLRETEACNLRPGCVWEHFEVTPLLPPSALGLVVCKHEAIAIAQDAQATVLTIYVPPHLVAKTEYVAKVFPQVFHYFEAHFRNNPYPVDKLDLVLVNGEPSVAQLGLIALHSDQMLLDKTRDANQLAIFSALAQAVALQWLREGPEDSRHLAGASKFLAHLAAMDVKMAAEDIFILSVVQPALKRAEEAFANKGRVANEDKFACVLRMARYALGSVRFNQEMNAWMANATADGQLAGILASWMRTPAYPVIAVSRGDGWMVTIEQRSILPDAEHRNSSFVVPLTYVSQSASANVHNLTLREPRIRTNLHVKPDEWILMNFKQTGFYRVNYDRKTWNMLIRQLHDDPSLIPAINRAALINDAFALADANMLDVSVAFNLLKYLSVSNESELLPWRVAIDSLNRYEMSFVDSTDYGIFRKFKVDLLSPLWQTRHAYNPDLTRMIESELCKLQFKPCVDTALNIYGEQKHRKDVDVADWVYCTAIRSHDEDEFDLIFNQTNAPFDLRLRRKLLQSLACSTLPWKISSLLELSVSSLENALILWPAFAANEISRWVALQFLEEKWKRVTQFLEDETKADIAVVIIDSYLSTFTTAINLKKVQTLCNNSNDLLHSHFQTAIASIVRQIEWSAFHGDSFIKCLSNN